MINVCIDMNYLFHKTFGIFSGFGSKNPGDILSSNNDKNLFMRKVITDLCYALNQIPDINKVICCFDSHSWRKDYLITRSIYKNNREKSEGVDWGSFFKLMDEFGEFLDEMGFISSKYGGAEGDDLLWAWSKHLEKSDDCVIILSGDKDMHQLVKYNDNKWTNIWTSNSKNNRLIVDKEWNNITEDIETTIFDVTPTSGSNDSKIAKLISSCILDRIDTKEFIFKKILIGDKKDNVPSVFPFIKNDKNHNVTESHAKKIWDFYLKSKWSDISMENIWKDPEFLDWLAGLTLRMIAQTDNKDNRILFKKFYEENAILVWLNENTIPYDIIDGMNEQIISLSNKERKKLILDKRAIIDKSPWGEATSAPQGFDPFELFK